MFVDLGDQDAIADRQSNHPRTSGIECQFHFLQATSTPIHSAQQQAMTDMEILSDASLQGHASSSCSGIQLTLGMSGSRMYQVKHIEVKT